MTAGEFDRRDDISRKIHVPFHGDGIFSQFQGYGKLKEFDWEGYQEKYGNLHRLDRILEREGDHPNNCKASKQADRADAVLSVFEGIHLGVMAGTVDVIQRCFTGIETRAGVLHFDPCLQRELHCSQTTLRCGHHTLHLKVTHERLEVASRPATALPITIAYRAHFRELSPGQAAIFRLIQPRKNRP